MADKFGNPDLQTALATFVSGAKEYGIAQSLYQANEQVQQIKASAMKDAEKRASLNNLANSMVMQMAGQGADAAKIASVFGAIKPVMPSTPDQAVMLGLLNDDKEMLSIGKKGMDLQLADNLKLLQAKMEGALEIAEAKASAKTQPLTQGMLDKIAEADESLTDLNDIKSQVAANPALVGIFSGRLTRLRGEAGLGEQEGVFFGRMEQFFNEYRKRITGAAAPIAELNQLRAALMSGKETPTTFNAKLDALISKTQRYKDIKLKTYGAGGRNMGTLGGGATSTTAAPTPSIPGLKL